MLACLRSTDDIAAHTRAIFIDQPLVGLCERCVIHVSDVHRDGSGVGVPAAVLDGVGEAIRACAIWRGGIGDAGARRADGGGSIAGRTHGNDRQGAAVGIAVVAEHINVDGSVFWRGNDVINGIRHFGLVGLTDVITIAAWKVAHTTEVGLVYRLLNALQADEAVSFAFWCGAGAGRCRL